VIPKDGRKHDPKKAIEATYMGYTVGHWDGVGTISDGLFY
jgi:hypothetical protein